MIHVRQTRGHRIALNRSRSLYHEAKVSVLKDMSFRNAVLRCCYARSLATSCQ